MSRITTRSISLSLRVPSPMRDGLDEVAATEANTASAVARRYIAAGLARERPEIATSPVSGTPEAKQDE